MTSPWKDGCPLSKDWGCGLRETRQRTCNQKFIYMCQNTFTCMSWYSHCHHVWSNSQTNKPVCNKQTNIIWIYSFIQSLFSKVWQQWPNNSIVGKRLSLSVTVPKMNSYHILSKPFLLLSLLLVDNCFSETTIQPTEKDGCPLFLVHGGVESVPQYFYLLSIVWFSQVPVSRRFEAQESRIISSPDWVVHMQEGEGGRGKHLLSLQVHLRIGQTIQTYGSTGLKMPQKMAVWHTAPQLTRHRTLPAVCKGWEEG